ncbi:hypothetical protein [Hellea balneolensis]|uniref:hypothetical protein n=1 Tax=Hellea balneolensis TaxID=287478 RepID=UPI0004127D2B|nr:hypothetical protein [Hellea balneolensis]
MTDNLELKRVPNVGAAWQTVALENTYSDAIVVCTYNLPSAASPPVVTRIQNITSTSFQLRIQQYENSSVVTPSDVHCVISDEGAYNSGGLKYEARKVISDQTSGLSVPGGWGNINNEDVSSDITQTYANPHVVGQVMSFNDANASVFWNYDCDSRGNGAFFSGQADGICVGKHIGQINGSRAAETLGYIVIEASSGTVNDISFAAAVGPDSGAGVGNNPPYNYTVSGDFDIGILTQQGEDGGQGGWAVLYGNDPLPSNQISWAIDEEVVAGDKTRTHTSENVGYWIFDNNQAPNMTANKDVKMYSGNSSPYAIPGSDVVYDINVENSGSGAIDTDSLEIIDAMPAELSFKTGSVSFIDNDSGLTFNPVTDLAFSKSVTAPANFAACSDTPSGTYDPDITFICIAPKGSMSEGTLTPSSFTIEFQAAVK